MNIAWKDHEYRYCRQMVREHGDDSVSRDPKNVAAYLRLQAASAFRDGEYAISSHLGYAATCINEDARNNHEPRWDDAIEALEGLEAD